MHQIDRLGLRPQTTLGELIQRSPSPLAGFKRLTSKRREGRGGKGTRREGRGRIGRGRKGKRKGAGEM